MLIRCPLLDSIARSSRWLVPSYRTLSYQARIDCNFYNNGRSDRGNRSHDNSEETNGSWFALRLAAVAVPAAAAASETMEGKATQQSREATLLLPLPQPSKLPLVALRKHR